MFSLYVLAQTQELRREIGRMLIKITIPSDVLFNHGKFSFFHNFYSAANEFFNIQLLIIFINQKIIISENIHQNFPPHARLHACNIKKS